MLFNFLLITIPINNQPREIYENYEMKFQKKSERFNTYENLEYLENCESLELFDS